MSPAVCVWGGQLGDQKARQTKIPLPTCNLFGPTSVPHFCVRAKVKTIKIVF